MLFCEHVISVADPDPGSGIRDGVPFWPLDPGSGIRDGRKSASGSGIRDEQPGSYFLQLRNHFFAFFGVKILKFFEEDPGSGIRDGDSSDPGSGIRDGKKSDTGSGIRDKHPGSATLHVIHSCKHCQILEWKIKDLKSREIESKRISFIMWNKVKILWN